MIELIIMIDIAQIAKNLRFFQDDIWISRNMSSISYPDEYHDHYFQIEERSFWFQHRNNCILEILKRFPPDGDIFDIGGGNGYVSYTLKNSGYNTILVEPGISGARNARSRGLKPIICSSLDDAQFYENSMPAVGLFDVLEHINDDAGFLKKIQSLLMPGGRLYITVPAYSMLWSDEDASAGHYRRYRILELIDILYKCGYEIDYSTYFFMLLTLPILFFRTMPSKIHIYKNDPLKARNEHKTRGGIIGMLLNVYLRHEIAHLNRGKMPFGASCLIVARAKKDEVYSDN